jgi:hypothetical protein
MSPKIHDSDATAYAQPTPAQAILLRNNHIF